MSGSADLVDVYEAWNMNDSGGNWFFEKPPVGEYTFKYRLRANMAGTFRVGPATVQSMYAPEFNAYSAGDVLRIAPAPAATKSPASAKLGAALERVYHAPVPAGARVTRPQMRAMPAVCRATASRVSRLGRTKAGVFTRSRTGEAHRQSSAKTTRPAPAACACRAYWITLAEFPLKSPTVGLIWASAIFTPQV